MGTPVIATLVFIAASVVVVVVVVVVIVGKWFRSDYSPWRYIKNLLSVETPFEVSSPLSPSEAERRLKEETSRISLPFMMSQCLVGKVGNKSLNVGLHRPFRSSSFAPIFVGSITRSNNQTYISGVFRLHGFARAFMKFWFGSLMLCSAFAIPSGIAMLVGGQVEGAMGVIGPIAMFGFGIGFVKVGTKIGATNQKLIQDKIMDAVGGTAIRN